MNRMLWAHRSDEQLLAVQERIVRSIPAARLSKWYALVIPALNLRERRELLAAMRGGMPGEVFEAVTDAARRELGEGEWTAACSSAENAAC